MQTHKNKIIIENYVLGSNERHNVYGLLIKFKNLLKQNENR